MHGNGDQPLDPEAAFAAALDRLEEGRRHFVFWRRVMIVASVANLIALGFSVYSNFL